MRWFPLEKKGKVSALSIKGYRPRVLAFKILLGLVFLVLLISDASAQRDPGFDNSWRSRFVGSINFRLRDDSRLETLLQNRKRILLRLDDIDQRLSQARSRQQTDRQNLKAERERASRLREKRRDAKSFLDAYPGRKSSLNSNLSSAQTALNAQRSNLSTKKTALANAQTQLKNVNAKLSEANIKVRHLNKKIQTCKASIGNGCTKTELANLQSSRNAAKTKADELSNRSNSLKTKVTNLRNQVSSINSGMTRSQTKINNIKGQISKLDSRKATSQRTLNTINGQLAPIVQNIQKLEIRIEKRTTQLRDLRAQLSQTEQNLSRATSRVRSTRQIIIQEVLSANQSGVSNGEKHGLKEGYATARKEGQAKGSREGKENGLSDGERDGRKREEGQGYQDAYPVGQGKGQQAGQRKGNLDGVVKGNQLAGQDEGIEKGIARADRSDARKQGSDAGVIRGKAESTSVGITRGRQLAKDDEIKRLQAKKLRPLKVTGPYATAFQSGSPNFPGVRRTHYSPNSRSGTQLQRSAYKAGYVAVYGEAVESAFYEVIDGEYTSAYESAYQSFYSQANGRYYQDSYDSGYGDGDRDGYNQAYPIAYDSAFSSARDFTRSRPNRSSSAYRDSYKRNELAAYNREYKRLYDYREKELFKKTFDNLIEGKVAKYRKDYDVQIKKWSKTASVLKLVKFDVLDGGVSGVSVNDGVFLPKEDVVWSLNLANLGDKASSVSTLILEGKKFKIPSIPASSQVSLNYYAKSNAPIRLDDFKVHKFDLEKKLGKEFKDIETHFHKGNKPETIGTGDRTIRSELVLDIYPPSLVEKRLIFDKNNQVQLQVLNNSKKTVRDYEVVFINENRLNVSSVNFKKSKPIEGQLKIVSDPFKTLSYDEIYRQFVGSFEIRSNGVLIGRSLKLKKTIQASFNSKHKNVLLVDIQSRLARKSVEEFLSLFGQEFAVYDIDLNSDGKVLDEKKVYLFEGKVDRYKSLLKSMTQSSQGIALIVDPLSELSSSYKEIFEGQLYTDLIIKYNEFHRALHFRQVKNIENQLGPVILFGEFARLKSDQQLVTFYQGDLKKNLELIRKTTSVQAFQNQEVKAIALFKVLTRFVGSEFKLLNSNNKKIAELVRADLLNPKSIFQTVLEYSKQEKSSLTYFFPILESYVQNLKNSDFKKELRKDIKRAGRRVRKFRKELGGQKYFNEVVKISGQYLKSDKE